MNHWANMRFISVDGLSVCRGSEPCTREGLIRRSTEIVRLSLFSVIVFSIFIEYGVKPLMGFCFARLFVQPEYYIVIEMTFHEF